MFYLFRRCEVWGWLIIINIQLMRKRITLQVDKLISKPVRKAKPVPQRPPPQKHLSFQQLYHLARKTTVRSNSRVQTNHLVFSSCNTSQHVESLKNSRQTPQNTTRNTRAGVSEKLNRSLQTKSGSIERVVQPVRSFSGEKRHWEGRRVDKPSKANRLDKADLNIKKGKEERVSSSSEPQSAEFEEDYRKAVSGLDHSKHEHLRETECFLGVQECFQILRQLHYLRRIEDEKYFVRLWQQLQGEGYGGVPSNNLLQFLGYINHYQPSDFYSQSKVSPAPSKKIIINHNLKIVASQKSKLQIYEQYLALRVNRILYGTDYSTSNEYPLNNPTQEKKLQRTSNIKIVEQQPQQQRQKTAPLAQTRKPSFLKQPMPSQAQVVSNPQRRAVRLKSANHPRTRKFEDVLKCEEQRGEEGCCREVLETKESGKNLTSNESESSIQSGEVSEEVVEQRRPMLSIDVNLGEGVSEKLVVYEGESASEVSQRLVEKYHIDDSLRVKFEGMLSGHLRNLLWRIEEVSEEMFSDRQE